MFKELETVALTRDLPEEGLKAGDLGAIVHVYRDGEAFEVEFVSLTGETLALIDLDSKSIRRVGNREIAHVRQVA